MQPCPIQPPVITPMKIKLEKCPPELLFAVAGKVSFPSFGLVLVVHKLKLWITTNEYKIVF